MSTRSRSYSPPGPAEIIALAEWRDIYSCRPDPRSTIQESDMGSQQSERPFDKAESALISVANSATSSPQPTSISQPDVDMVIEDTSQSCLKTTNLPGRESNAITAQGHNDESTETGSGLCVTYETDTPTPSTARNMLVTGDQQAPLSSSPCPIQPREIEFSHVEIRNVRTIEPGGPVEVNNKTTNRKVGGIHTSCADGPWRLDRTILSVDIREAERIPVFVGYSTYRVVDGQLIQSVTLVQGNTGLPYTEKPMCKVTQERGHGTRKTCKADPVIRGPLSLKEKRDIVRLKEEGYTWNEITSRFPSRKKGTLQGIYYTQIKDSRNRITQTH